MMEKLKKDSPHQKLLQQGASALSDTELLAIVLCHGNKTRMALAFAKQLLTFFGDLPRLLAAERDDFQYQMECQIFGNLSRLLVHKQEEIRHHMERKMLSYVQLQAALELSRRCERDSVSDGCHTWSLRKTRQFWQTRRAAKPGQAFLVMLFDAQQQLLSFEELLSGSPDRITLYQGDSLTQEVVNRAVQAQATGTVFIHHDPSFDGCPTPFDITFGQWLLLALGTAKVKFLDCLVMGNGHSVSLMDKGFLI